MLAEHSVGCGKIHGTSSRVEQRRDLKCWIWEMCGYGGKPNGRNNLLCEFLDPISKQHFNRTLFYYFILPETSNV